MSKTKKMIKVRNQNGLAVFKYGEDFFYSIPGDAYTGQIEEMVSVLLSIAENDRNIPNAVADALVECLERIQAAPDDEDAA